MTQAPAPPRSLPALEAGGTASLFVDDLRAFADSMLEQGAQVPPVLRTALDLALPMLGREMAKVPDERLRFYCRAFADQLYALADGKTTFDPT